MDSMESQVMTGTCLNCGCEFNGRYCTSCGQSSKTGPLTVRKMLEGTFKGFIDFDKPLYRTLIGLTIRPGSMISEYVEGKRVGYANPIKYCLSISTLLVLLNRFRGTILQAANQSMSADPAVVGPAAEFLHRYNEINNSILPYSHLISMLMMPVLAGFLYLVFRKSKRSLADQMAFGCFAVGHSALLSITILVFNLHRYIFDAVVFLINVGPPLYIAWAAAGFNRDRIIPGFARGLLAYGLFLGVIVALIILVVLLR